MLCVGCSLCCIEVSVACFSVCSCRPNSGPQFANAPLGHNSISEMMPKLSVWANLSQRYTYQCVRATVVTDLMGAGFSPREVCAVTGHNNAQCLEHYDRLDREDSERRSKRFETGRPSATATATFICRNWKRSTLLESSQSRKLKYAVSAGLAKTLKSYSSFKFLSQNKKISLD